MKYLTYEELMALALDNYENGGDGTFECLDKKTFDSDEYYQTMTKEKALKDFATYKSICDEFRAMAQW